MKSRENISSCIQPVFQPIAQTMGRTRTLPLYSPTESIHMFEFQRPTSPKVTSSSRLESRSIHRESEYQPVFGLEN